MIGMTRTILDSMFLRQRNEITYEVLVTLMAEVSAIINSRPITAISYDLDAPIIKIGDVILLMDSSLPRFQWPVRVVERVYLSHNNDHVRKVQVRIVRDGKPVILTRPTTELVLLIN